MLHQQKQKQFAAKRLCVQEQINERMESDTLKVKTCHRCLQPISEGHNARTCN